MAAILGKWTCVAVDNLDAYMAANGVPENLREVARTNKPFLEVTQDGDEWCIKTTVGDKVKEVKFKLGQEFDTTALTGHPMKATVTLEGDKMVEKQVVGSSETHLERFVEGGQLVSKMTTKGVTATIKFDKA